MKKENQFRQAWIDGWINSRPDGVLHATIPQTPVEGPRSGPIPYGDDGERELCLTCPLPECVLDTHKHCRRLIEYHNKRRKERQDNGKAD